MADQPKEPKAPKEPKEHKEPKEKKPKAEASEGKPKKPKAAAEPAAEAPPKPPPPPRVPNDPRTRVLKKFWGKSLPKGPLRDRFKALMGRWDSGEDHGGVTVEELKAVLVDWRKTKTRGQPVG